MAHHMQPKDEAAAYDRAVLTFIRASNKPVSRRELEEALSPRVSAVNVSLALSRLSSSLLIEFTRSGTRGWVPIPSGRAIARLYREE